MTSLHQSELESAATDSVASSPRSEHQHDIHNTRVRFMCSFGGKILPRPHDNQLRYVGGETRIVAVHRSTSFSVLLSKLSKLAGSSNVTVKYQLPNEDLDALISVTTDEDVENMMDEYDRLSQNQNPRSARLRLFLFADGDDSRTSSIGSLLDGSANRENWFFDALNSSAAPGAALERGRSEVSSIVSEVPDYLFGLDNSDETQNQTRESKLKPRPVLHENVSFSDPGSPAPFVSSPFCSTSSATIAPSMPDLPPVKTKLDNPAPVMESKQSGQVDGFSETVETQAVHFTGQSGQPVWHYVSDSQYSNPAIQQMPVYYVSGSVPPPNVPIQSMPIRTQYIQQYSVPAGQIPIGYQQVPGQVYGGAMRPVVTMEQQPYSPGMRMVSADGGNQQFYLGVRNRGLVQGYPGMMVPGSEEIQTNGLDSQTGRVSETS